MTPAKTDHALTPWYAQAGAACGIVPIARFVGPNVFALKAGGYGCLFSLTGIDEEGLTDQELESRVRGIEGALRGLPEGSALYQYTRVMSGVELPRRTKYDSPVTESFVNDRLTFFDKTAKFRRIDLHWCLTFEPARPNPLQRKPQENSDDSSRMMSDLQKAATILESHLASSLGLKVLDKADVFRFFSYLFNLEDWAHHDHLQSDQGVDRQIVKSTVQWHGDHLRVGKRHVQMFSLMNTPEASRPCLFSDLLSLDCDAILCSTWRPKSSAAARKEIDQQEKFNEFFKVGVFQRVMSGKNVASLDTTAGAKAASGTVDDLSEVIRSLDRKAHGEFSFRLLLAGKTPEQLRDTVPGVHRVFVDARAQAMEETLGNLSAFYAMFPGNGKFNVHPLWLAEDHHARLSSVFAPHTGHPLSDDLESEYLNIFETRTGTPFYQDVYVEGVRVMLILGPTGTGKTTVLESIREGAEREGYTVEGFAPSSRAAGQLRDAGIRATTLQSFVARGGDPSDNASPHLYMLDESSLASTKQMRAFLDKIGPNDRVLVIGDSRQHQAVDAGRPFQQMQEAGMQTSRLSEIVRQKDPALLKAVELLAKGETAAGVKMLADQGRITEIGNGNDRIAAIAKDYAAKPENTLIISADNRSREAINLAVRTELRANGTLAPDSREFSALAHRSDMTGADRMWAARYNPGDVLQYATGSKAFGIERDSYATVRSVDAKTNTLTVERGDGELISYDPKRLKGVNVYREVEREIAVGERIQFTAQHKGLGVANRDLGTVTKIEPHQIAVKMDGKDERFITFDPTKMRHFEHGYAVTSHSAQGLTAGRIIANMDGETARSLINTRLAYVAISRAAEDARIYTNDAATIGQRLATEFSKTAAVDFTEKPGPQLIQKQRQAASPEAPRKEQSIREYADVNHRVAAVALDYAARPENTVIVAPDRVERIELTQLIRADLKAQGLVTETRTVPVLIEHQLAIPKLAASYTAGDIILYKAGNKAKEIAVNSAAIVREVDPKNNLLTVQTADGREIVYNPALTPSMTKLSTVYRPEQRDLGTGDRIQITMPDKEQGIRNRDLGTVTHIAPDHALTVRLDNGKTVKIDADKANYIEHGYTLEGTKNFHAHRVLVSIGGPAEVAAESALARAISRSSASTTFYTSDGPSLAENQAVERARIANTGRLVIDQTIHSVPTTAEIGKLFSLADIERHLAPIREALEPEDAAQFKWKGETGNVQTYQHTETGRNIHIDGKTGDFYAQDGRLTDQDAALDRAMPAGRAHSQQNELENSMGLGR